MHTSTQTTSLLVWAGAPGVSDGTDLLDLDTQPRSLATDSGDDQDLDEHVDCH